MTGEALLEALADAIAEKVAEKVAARLAVAPAAPALATAKNNPLGSSRAFLDASRRGDFPTFKRGREVVARWSDVAEYDRARMRPRRKLTTATPTQTDAIEAALRRAGALP